MPLIGSSLKCAINYLQILFERGRGSVGQGVGLLTCVVHNVIGSNPGLPRSVYQYHLPCSSCVLSIRPPYMVSDRIWQDRHLFMDRLKKTSKRAHVIFILKL